MWCFYHTQSFEDGLLVAVNMGGDADTIGAIYGQLAGAFYGIEGIPQHWIEGLEIPDYMDELIRSLAGC